MFMIFYLEESDSKLFNWFDRLVKPGKGLPLFISKENDDDYFGFTHEHYKALDKFYLSVH